MRRTAAEKYEVIRLVEGSDLPVRQTLRELQVNRSTFYVWYHRYAERGRAGLPVETLGGAPLLEPDSATGAAARGEGGVGGSRTVAAGAGLAADRPGGPIFCRNRASIASSRPMT